HAEDVDADFRAAPKKVQEIVPMEHEGLRGGRRHNRRRSRLAIDQRQFAKEVALVQRGEQRFLATVRGQHHLDLALSDDEEAPARVPFVEDDFSSLENATPNTGFEGGFLFGTELREQRYVTNSLNGHWSSPLLRS